MRITDALKPVTDALAAAGMSLDTATYKDGKIHATLSAEAPKATGSRDLVPSIHREPGFGPEYPPEGFRLVAPGERVFVMEGELWRGAVVWLRCCRKWFPCNVRPVLGDPRTFAVPIAPKPEPVKLTDQEKIVGWRGPTGFRLQTFQNREVQCAVCKKTIKAGERLARWRVRFPESGDLDHVVGHPGNEENHSHAHVDCLYKVSRTPYLSHGLRFRMTGVAFHFEDVPKWLQEKRRKYDKQHGTP